METGLGLLLLQWHNTLSTINLVT